MLSRMKDYRPLLSDVAILVEDVAVYLERDLQDDQLETAYSSEEVRELLEKINEMFGDIDDEYDD